MRDFAQKPDSYSSKSSRSSKTRRKVTLLQPGGAENDTMTKRSMVSWMESQNRKKTSGKKNKKIHIKYRLKLLTTCHSWFINYYKRIMLMQDVTHMEN